jgi:glycosyltransferase involved in cell wall biosynthesis
MKISGFTFIRNGVELDYPFIESITSVLPAVDEMVIVVGDCSDGTKEKILALQDAKIRIINTVWDESLRKGGEILAQQTNIALDHITGDWGFYIQGDEVIHEKYLENVRSALQKWQNHPEVEGLLFHYHHFYGSYEYIGTSRKWYRREIRIVRNDPSIRSYKDAQGFRKNGKKLQVKAVDAYIYHYGWVRDPKAQLKKNVSFNKYWHDDEWIAEHVDATSFDYDLLESLDRFEGTHPAVMKDRIVSKNWKFSYDPSKKRMSFKEKMSFWIEKLFGWRPGEYKNYTLR